MWHGWPAMSTRPGSALIGLWIGLEGMKADEANAALEDLHERLRPGLWDYEVALMRKAKGPAEVLKVKRGGEEATVERLHGDSMRNAMMDFFQDSKGLRSADMDCYGHATKVAYFEGPMGYRIKVGEARLEERKGEHRKEREAKARQWALGWCGFGIEGLEVEEESVAGIE